ncbi:MAG: hypothetical protein KF681_17725 [Bdellovibrionaceae bacterium]|nr:hypothetical protein [Pseudobdellovibrionaceae bacterium]
MTRRLFGTGLFLTHFAALYHFLFSDSEGVLIDTLLYKTQVCWPFVPFCREMRPAFTVLAPALCATLGLLAMAGVASLWWPRWRPFTPAIAIAALAVKYAIILQDYTLMGNFHYITLALWAAYLLDRESLWSPRFALVSCYVAAGLVKLHPEWLSGSVLRSFIGSFKPEWLVHTALLEALAPAALLNVILELFVALFLLSSKRVFFAAALVLLTAFHLLSWPVVGVTFPVTMLLLLAPLWFLVFSPSAWAQEASLQRQVFRRPRAWLVPALVLLLQLPARVGARDPALTGEGRLWSINMLDSHPFCRAFYLFETEPGVWIDISSLRSDLGPRLQCDPVVISEIMTSSCLNLQSDAPSLHGHAALFSKRGPKGDAQKIFAIPDSCEKRIRFHPFLKNDWMEP